MDSYNDYNIYIEIGIDNVTYHVMLRSHVYRGDGEPQWFSVEESILDINGIAIKPDRTIYTANTLTNPLHAFHQRIGELVMEEMAIIREKGKEPPVVHDEEGE